ncbi:MAG TPA: roadblock/LC7 domain-containing protein [Candidatus Binatia bacterium]|nr:roadblock/LC7 domain-containing protein [Candidatus Binatia bacterium]
MPTLPQLIEEDVSELNSALQELLIKSDASSAMVIDKGGFIITQCGRAQQLDTTTLSALSAASFAATESIATLVGEHNFSSIYQQGDHSSLLVMNVDEFCLLSVIFKASLSVGAIKYYAGDTIKRVATQLHRACQRTPEAGLDLSMLNLADPSPIFKMKVA